MNGITKKISHGLLFALALLATANANAAATDVTIPSTPVVFATSQKIGTESAAQNVTLTAGTAAVTFESIGIESANFTLEGDTCGGGLIAGASCILPVKFTPVAAGKRIAELIIRTPDASNAVNGALTVYLQGTAIGKYSQTITFGTAPTINVGGTGTVTATASSTLAVTYSSNTASVCTITGSTVTGVAAGTCTIAANQAGNADYNPATQTQDITIGKGSQTISPITAPASIAVGATGTASATATSNLLVTLDASPANVCTISLFGVPNYTVTGVAAGTCTITATQAGNANYNAAPAIAAKTIEINTKTSQTITFGTAPTVAVGTTGTVSATASSGLAVTYGTTTPSICTISGSTVTGVAEGTCIIAANQAGDATRNPAPQVTQGFNVTAAPAVPAADAMCTTYGLPNTIELAKAGNTSKTFTMPKDGAYVFTFTTGASGTLGSSNTQYSTVNQYMSISKNKCDFSVPAGVCAKQGATGPFIRWKVGTVQDGIQCMLEPNTLYYVNLRDANRSGGTYTSTCPAGGCGFKIY